MILVATIIERWRVSGEWSAVWANQRLEIQPRPPHISPDAWDAVHAFDPFLLDPSWLSPAVAKEAGVVPL